MRIILTPLGTSGDVIPYIVLGRELASRGHDVTVFTGGPFKDAVEKVGLRFVSSWPTDSYYRFTQDPDLWHHRKGWKVIFNVLSETLHDAYWQLRELHEPGHTAYVGHTLAMATRMLEETIDAPFVSVQLAPMGLRSLHAQPALAAGKHFTFMPLWFKKTLWWTIDKWLLDPPLTPAINALGKELGLAPISRIFNSWANSPQGVIGLFPPWFGRPQPDWPKPMSLTGFPLIDADDQATLDTGLEAFLNAGEPPIAFTPGSGNRQAVQFFDAAKNATNRLGKRAIFLTRFEEHLPPDLPDNIRHESFAPFSTLLPRCAAIVHHAGIGTVAQGFAAGIPQLTMPMAFDQPDNATRIARLGVGAWILPRKFKGNNVAAALQRLLDKPEVAERCDVYKKKVEAARPIGDACDVIEGTIERWHD